MTLTEVLDKCYRQLRLSPLITTGNLINWLGQGIRSFAIKSGWLDAWTIIPAKADTAKYLLPADHVATTAVYYDGQALGKCLPQETELVSPTMPTYYTEEEWEDEASDVPPGSFAIHYALNDYWPLQLGRAQNSYGRKTITLISAPTVDGYAISSPVTQAVVGTVSGDYFYAPNGALGRVYSIISTEDNITLFYKKVDSLPETEDDNIVWSDILGVVYTCGAVALALGTEDDEYDRYRAWLYEQISNNVSSILRNMVIKR